MRLAYLFFSILMAFTAFGQPSPINRRAFALSGLATPQVPLLPPNIRFRWKASDITNSPVTIWTDEIQGFNFTTNGVNGQGPTVKSNFVAFDGETQFMVVSNLDIWQTNAVLFVVIPRAHDNQVIVNSANDRTFGINGGKWILEGDPVNGSITDGSMVDFLYTGGPGASFVIYTNGVSMYSGVESFNGLWSKIGKLYNDTEYYSGKIAEIIVWYNVSFFTNNLVPAISNVHYYVTNTYAVDSLIPDFLWYKFTEGSGSTVADSSGNGNTGNFGTGATWVTGESGSGYALQTDGTHVGLSTSATINMSSAKTITVAYWEKLINAYGGSAIGLEYSDSYAVNPGGFIRYRVSGTPNGYRLGESATTGTYTVNELSTPIPTSTWTHVLCVFNNTVAQTVTVYTNAVLATTTSVSSGTGPQAFGSFKLYVGARNGDVAPDNIAIDDLRIYMGDRSGDRVAIMNGQY